MFRNGAVPRKSIGDKVMTDAERQARRRAVRAADVPVIRTRRATLGPTSSSAASCSIFCRAGSTAFVTTACSPLRRAGPRARELLADAPPPDDDVPEEPLDVRPSCP
jgi:hypothetical protein